MTLKPVNSMKPLFSTKSSTQQQTSNQELKRPNPPTPEAIEKAQFKDKTYSWNGR
jgi:hypothetical protein